MTTEKDAMALADRLREAERNPYGAVRDPQARASIAAEAADTIEALIARATRAEAELAAVRKLPAMILHDSWAGTANRLSRWAKLPDNKNALSGQTMEEAAAFIRHYIDAARGGE